MPEQGARGLPIHVRGIAATLSDPEKLISFFQGQDRWRFLH